MHLRNKTPDYTVAALIITIFLATLFYAPKCSANTSDHILALLTSPPKGHKIKPAPGHPLARNAEKRARLASAIDVAAKAYRIPPALMVAVAYREGGFRNDVIGELPSYGDGPSIGERTMFQLAPRTLKFAKALDPRCTETTVEGSAFCSAAWLNKGRELCGDLKGGLAWYVSGRTCKYDTGRTKFVVNDRFGIAEKLRAQ